MPAACCWSAAASCGGCGKNSRCEPRQKRGYTGTWSPSTTGGPRIFWPARIAKPATPPTACWAKKAPGPQGKQPLDCGCMDPIDGTSNYMPAGGGTTPSPWGCCSGGQVPGTGAWCWTWRPWPSAGVRASGSPSTRTVPGGDAPGPAVLHVGCQTLHGGPKGPWGRTPCGAVRGSFRAVRYLGCASLELCRLAQGEPGAYVNSHLRLWDFAGALPVLQRAGCSLRALPMGSGHYFVCAYSAAGLGQACLPWLPPTVRRQLERGKGEEFHVEN